jgi:hypothetical protein
VEHNEAASLWRATRRSVEAAIGKYPVVSFGAALMAGVILGWWIKRK